MTTRYRCVVVGDAKATETARLLSTSGVSARSCVPSSNPMFFDSLKREDELETVAVFMQPLNEGEELSFLRKLARAVGPQVNLHLLDDTGEERSSLNGRLSTLADVISKNFPMEPFNAATLIKRRWFPAKEVDAPPVVDYSNKRAQPEEDTDDDDDDPLPTSPQNKSVDKKAAVPARPLPSPPKAPSPKPVPQLQIPKLTSLKVGKVDAESTFGRMLQGLEKNAVLPKMPVAKGIVGMHGQVIELDPRRVRPLPDNPRSADNPGFSKESLQELGESIREHGQLEDGLVCPITDDPQFDAQIIDAERRWRSCLLENRMFRTKVREDITAKDARELYILSVVRNTSKVPLTILEKVRIVQKFLGPEFGMSRKDVAKKLSMSVPSIEIYEKLLHLHPDVLAMVGSQEEVVGARGSARRSGKAKLTSQLALLLLPLRQEDQPALAQKIVTMSYIAARRYLIQILRDMGLHKPLGKHQRLDKRFGALAMLTRRNLDAYGEWGDMLKMPRSEFDEIVHGRTGGERTGLSEDLEKLAADLIDLAKQVRPKPV